MNFVPSPRLLLPLGLALLTACAQQKTGPMVVQDQQDDCPLSLNQGQPLVLTLPSNPTTGFRWVVRDAATNVLQSLGPEVYSTPEDAGLVGSAGQSTWRFKASQPGEGRLHLDYQRPWENDVAPAESFDCQISVK
ncbi:peptidase inhibitor I42 [Pseudomonas sp. BN415]|uniref:protease inhibitor I42 family protein n=1 Tax=Pseudomonas sp. BN415 TaxID=2567889 RepID=UPI002455E2A7|nr:protease inhibitor I42 family protein [Pseudomonas sp. BN415]MDH4583152.1 peptidase inhibitor I42 [Pseudomonas sp. BN415]